MIKCGDVLVCTENKLYKNYMSSNLISPLFAPIHVTWVGGDNNTDFIFSEFGDIIYTSEFHTFIKLSEYRKIKLNTINEKNIKENC